MRRALGAGLLALCFSASVDAGGLRFCSDLGEPTARQQDRLLQLSALVQQDLEARQVRLAVVARSGTNLRRFGIRYTHAGLSLRANEQGAWAVRQLYYACDEGRPRLYDQGLAAFLFGADELDQGHLLLLLLPEGPATALELAAQDRERALTLLAPRYQANAHPFSLLAQNCNQWLAELLAEAWGAAALEGAPRQRAQAWLQAEGYAPQPVALAAPWWVAAALLPYLSLEGHPPEDRAAGLMRSTLPEHLAHFIRARHPQTQVLQWCYRDGRAVLREGAESLSEDCQADPADRVWALDPP